MKAVTIYRNLKNSTSEIDPNVVEDLVRQFLEEEDRLLEARHIRTVSGHQCLVVELNRAWNKLTALVYDDAQFVIIDPRFRADYYFKLRINAMHSRAIREHNLNVAGGEHTKEA